MSKYIKMSNNLLKDGIKPKEIALYAMLITKTNYNTNKSNVQQSTLANQLDKHIETVSIQLKKLEKSNYITVTRKFDKVVKRVHNTYTINNPTDNYSEIPTDIVYNDNLTDGEKGLLIALKMLCINGTNRFTFSLNEIAKDKLINISKQTLINDLKSLKLKGFVNEDNSIKEGIFATYDNNSFISNIHKEMFVKFKSIVPTVTYSQNIYRRIEAFGGYDNLNRLDNLKDKDYCFSFLVKTVTGKTYKELGIVKTIVNNETILTVE